MGSREREQTTTTAPTPHHLSSLVVRPAESGGGGSDYEPGEVRREPPSYSRPDRFHENSGHGTRAGSGSPLSRRKFDYHYRSDFDNSGPLHHGRGFRGGRGPGRFRDSSPPYGRGRGGGRFSGRDFDGPRFGPGPLRGEGMSRNNPNVSPREGDWICPDPSCGNLNFARREYCNNCNRLRIGPRDSPRRNYPGPPRFSGLPLDVSPGRGPNGYRSPPRAWGRDGPKEFGAGPPHTRHGGGGRFPDNHFRRERPDYREEDDFRERGKFDRPMPPEWNHRDRGRDNFFKERRGFDMRNDRRPLSPPPPPPPPPHRARFARDTRERSRSPMRNGPPVDYRRDSYMDRSRDGRWGMARDRIDDHPY
ncbi:zinc finger protein [Macleaya cordata]|uniref:Zinc finger protein n=1 Tax=Macleaya cordata TaxID=56857 RepID=A0A200PP87_MACCD|nr:zinc finger protein [Macleaya cordata]